MSDDALIRRENLKRLMAQRKWTTAQLPAELGWGRYTYWRDLMEDPDKSFGEKVARRIEDAAKLPRGWLDHISSTIPPAQPRQLGGAAKELSKADYRHWRIVADELAKQLEATVEQVNPVMFLTAVDDVVAHIGAEAKAKEVAGYVAGYLRSLSLVSKKPHQQA